MTQRASSFIPLVDRRPIYEWAAENVKLHSAYTINGAFNPSVSRHLLAPMDDLKDDRVRSVTIVAPVRSGKTMIVDIWVPWIICNDPGPVMWNMQTDAIAKRHAETRAMPLLDACDAVRQYMPSDRYKKRAQEIIFNHGMPLYIQGPSLGNLQSVGIRYLINDECWMWDQGLHAHALARVGDFERLGMSKVVNISQAGLVGDDLDLQFDAGNQCEWQVPCLECGKYFDAAFDGLRDDGSRWGMRWDDGDEFRNSAGEWNVRKVLPTIRYECQHCGHPHHDTPATHRAWNERGRYRVGTDDCAPENRSYHFESVIMRDWSKLVDEFLRAQNALKLGVADPLTTFMQKRRAIPWSEDFRNTAKITIETAEGWEDETVRIMTVDRQADGLHYCLVRSWSDHGESRRVWFGRCFSADEIHEKQTEHKVDSNRVFIDCGFEPRDVYRACVMHGWVAMRGSANKHFAHVKKVRGKTFQVQRSYSPPRYGDPEVGTSRQGRKQAVIIEWSNPTIKDRLQRLIDLGKYTEPPPDDESEDDILYRKQMRGQWKVRKKNADGQVRMLWVDNGDDHARDCGNMQVVAATILRKLPDIQAREEAE